MVPPPGTDQDSHSQRLPRGHDEQMAGSLDEIRRDMEKIWSSINQIKTDQSASREQAARADENQKHQATTLSSLTSKVDAVGGKVDTLVLTLAKASGMAGAGDWISRIIGAVALVVIGAIISKYTK